MTLESITLPDNVATSKLNWNKQPSQHPSGLDISNGGVVTPQGHSRYTMEGLQRDHPRQYLKNAVSLTLQSP